MITTSEPCVAPTLVLFAHGARDPLWAQPFQRVRELVQQQLPTLRVELAFLELMTPTLDQLIASLTQQGCTRVTLVPIFLGQGGHVRRDLPALIAQLQASHARLRIDVVPAVGESDAVLQAIAAYCIDAAANVLP